MRCLLLSISSWSERPDNSPSVYFGWPHYTLHQASLLAQTVKHLPPMRETRVHSLGWEDPLEEEMATHSNTLSGKVPWMEEPGRVQSTGSQRVRHAWATSLSLSVPVQGAQGSLSAQDPSLRLHAVTSFIFLKDLSLHLAFLPTTSSPLSPLWPTALAPVPLQRKSASWLRSWTPGLDRPCLSHYITYWLFGQGTQPLKALVSLLTNLA